MAGLSLGLGLSAARRQKQGGGATAGPRPSLPPFVTALWGQSEHQHILNVYDDGIAAAAGRSYEVPVAQDRVTFWWHDRVNLGAPGVRSVVVNDANIAAGSSSSGLTRAMVAMANTFMRHLPGRDIKIIMHTQSGTTPVEIMDDTFVPNNPDGGPPRGWASDWALNAAATADGHPVQHPWHSWFAAPGSWGDDYGQNMFAFLKGRDHVTGADLVYSEAAPLTLNGIQVHRTLRDLYTHDPVWIGNPGAHVFIPVVDLQNATQVAGGGTQVSLDNKQRSTESWRTVIRNPALAAHFGPEVFQIQGYANGFDKGDGTWTDQSHPSAAIDGGINRMARLIAHAILRGAGVTSYTVPEITHSDWQPNGDYMEFWSSAGAITTARGGTGPGTTLPHWTDVLSVEIDGEPAERAEIQSNGRVRVYPNSGSFTSSTLITFGRGGASGWIAHDTDAFAGLWDDYPVVDLGLSDVPGIPLKPLPDPAVLSSTIAGLPTFTSSATGPYFVDPAGNLPNGTSQFTALFVGAVSDLQGGTPTLLSLSGLSARLQYMSNNGAVRLSVRDDTGTTLVAGVTSGSALMAPGIQATVLLSIDLVAGYARVWVDGALVIDEVMASSSPTFSVAREISLLADPNGRNQVLGTVERLAAWFAATANGTEPSIAPAIDLQGPAASVNASAWKLGDDAS